MSEHTLHLLLREHVPAPAVAYCLQLWQQQPFDFKLRKSRATKVGDFTCRQGKKPRITVNRDSHPFLFLITYIHEVAHLVVHQQYGWKVEAHGKIWKETFIRLLNPVMTDEIFPPALLTVLRRHMRNPKASSFS
ncbi:MAG: SprT-like domain-containing protein, partial [Cyclobacteriaceae bacterium]|nr:SprT-like domain-containing protein [Cyclobacteriaceae bacterium]